MSEDKYVEATVSHYFTESRVMRGSVLAVTQPSTTKHGYIMIECMKASWIILVHILQHDTPARWMMKSDSNINVWSRKPGDLNREDTHDDKHGCMEHLREL